MVDSADGQQSVMFKDEFVGTQEDQEQDKDVGEDSSTSKTRRRSQRLVGKKRRMQGDENLDSPEECEN